MFKWRNSLPTSFFCMTPTCPRPLPLPLLLPPRHTSCRTNPRQYVYKFCSPTRTSFVSGRLPIHVNQENSATEQPLAGIPVGMTTIAERLNATGYSCHQVGKWHCGQASKKHIPSGRGFNTSLGFFNFGEDHYTQIRGGKFKTENVYAVTTRERHGLPSR